MTVRLQLALAAGTPAGAELQGHPGEEARVLVLELEPPLDAGIAAIRSLQAQVPQTRIVALGHVRSPAYARRALQAGAVAYLVAGDSAAELCQAIRAATAGVEYLSPSLRPVADGRGPISERETEILRLIALGHTSTEIATALHVSRRTVDTHRASLHRKLGVRTRADLVRFALVRGLLAE